MHAAEQMTNRKDIYRMGTIERVKEGDEGRSNFILKGLRKEQ